MKSIPKLIKRFVGILLISFILVIILNIVIISVISSTRQGDVLRGQRLLKQRKDCKRLKTAIFCPMILC